MTAENEPQVVTPDSAKCRIENLSLYLKHINSFRFLLGWLENDGKALLEKEAPLLQDELEALVQQCSLALTKMPQTTSIKMLYQLAIRKGITSLSELIKTGQTSREDSIPYLYYLTTQFLPHRIGVGSHNCTIEESREMIDSLIPIAQALKNIDMLRHIGKRRFPGKDNFAQELIVEHFCNWES